MNELDIRNGCVGLSADDSDAVEYTDGGGAAAATGSEYCGMISCPWIRFFTCILRRSRMCSFELANGCLELIGSCDGADDPAAVNKICGIDIKIPIDSSEKGA